MNEIHKVSLEGLILPANSMWSMAAEIAFIDRIWGFIVLAFNY